MLLNDLIGLHLAFVQLLHHIGVPRVHFEVIYLFELLLPGTIYFIVLILVSGVVGAVLDSSWEVLQG